MLVISFYFCEHLTLCFAYWAEIGWILSKADITTLSAIPQLHLDIGGITGADFSRRKCCLGGFRRCFVGSSLFLCRSTLWNGGDRSISLEHFFSYVKSAVAENKIIQSGSLKSQGQIMSQSSSNLPVASLQVRVQHEQSFPPPQLQARFFWQS